MHARSTRPSSRSGRPVEARSFRQRGIQVVHFFAGLCYRNLFYTGVTRGRKLCIVVGRRDVVNRMMSNIRQNLRYSGLAALLAQALPPEQENL